MIQHMAAAFALGLILLVNPNIKAAPNLVRIDFSAEIIASADETIPVGSTFTGQAVYDPSAATNDNNVSDNTGSYDSVSNPELMAQIIIDQFNTTFDVSSLFVVDNGRFGPLGDDPSPDDLFSIRSKGTEVPGRPGFGVTTIVLSFIDEDGLILSGDDVPSGFSFGDLEHVTNVLLAPNDTDFRIFGNGLVQGVFTDVTVSVDPSPDISIGNVEITQAVFGSKLDPNDNMVDVDLVLNRETAILAQVKIIAQTAGTVLLGAQLGSSNPDDFIASTNVDFVSGMNVKEVPLFWSPTRQGRDTLTVTIDPDMSVVGDNPDDNLDISKIVVHETINLVVPTVPLSSCRLSFLQIFTNCYGPLNNNDVNTHVDKSSGFIQATYPVADNGFQGGLIRRIPGKRTRSKNSLYADLEKAFATAPKNAKRVLMIVPSDYVEYHDTPHPTVQDYCCVKPDGTKICPTGMFFNNSVAMLVEEGHWTSAAHEVGHSFLLGGPFNGEAYKSSPVCGNPVTKINNANEVDGYSVKERKHITAIEFMGSDPGLQTDRWVSTKNWNILLRRLKTSTPDPEIITIGIILGKDGTFEMLPWRRFIGTPTLAPFNGDYKIDFIDKNENILLSIPFGVDFQAHLEFTGAVEIGFVPIIFSTPYPEATNLIRIFSPNGNLITEVNPIIKVLNDAINEVIELPEQCYTNNFELNIAVLKDKLNVFEQSIKDGNTDSALETLGEIGNSLDVMDRLIAPCQEELINTKEDLLALIENTIKRLETRIVDEPPIPGDLDNDGDVDRNDLNILLAARDTPASGADDPKDLDGDGMITALDARKLTLLCTRPRCATQ